MALDTEPRSGRTARDPDTDAATGRAGGDGLASPMAVTAWALRQQRRSMVLWALAVAAVTGIYVSFWDVMGTGELAGLVEGMPEGLATALGYDDIASATGYLGSTVFGLLAPILLLVFAISYAAKVLAGVEEEGALELELSSPVSRRSVLLERYLALVSQVALLSLVVGVVAIAIATAIDMDVQIGNILATSLGLFLLVLSIATVTFAAGAATGRKAIGLGVGSAVAVVGYIGDALAPLLDNGGWLEAISPFAWYLGSDPLVNGIDPIGFGGLLALTIVAAAVALLTFDRRDLGV